MAKTAVQESTGFMSPDLSLAPAPASADYGLLIQAGQARGKAAQIAGESTAQLIKTATSIGEAAYSGYVQAQAQEAATKVTQNLFTPQYVGEEAQRTIQDQSSELAQELSAAGGNVAVVKDYEARAKRIADAVAAKTFTQDQALSRLSADMRKLIATHPGQAQAIRKVFNEVTGRGDWDVRPIEAALTAKAKTDEFQKAQMRLLENDAKRIYESGIGSLFKMKSSAEVFANIVQGTDYGVRMGTMLQSQNLIENSNKVKTSGDMNQFYSATNIEAHASRVQAAQQVFARLEQKGININAMVSPTEAQRKDIEDAYRTMKTAERNSLLAAQNDLAAKLRANPNMDRTVVDDTVKRIEDRLKNTPLTTDLDSMLSELKQSYTAANVRADTVLKAVQVNDVVLRNTWSQDLIAKMKDPRTRKQMVADYPNNPAVAELAAMFEGRQNSFSQDMQNMSMIAEGLFSKAASPAARAAAMDADNTPEGRRAKAAVIQLHSAKGADVLKQDAPATEFGVSAVVSLAKNFTPNESSWNTLYQTAMSDKINTILPNEVDSEQFKAGIVQRIDFWLGPNNAQSYSIKLRDIVRSIPGVQVIPTENGQLALAGKQPTSPQEIAQMGMLQSQIAKANQLLQVYNKFTGSTVKAKQTVEDLYQLPKTPTKPIRPAPQTTGEATTNTTTQVGQSTSVLENLRKWRLSQESQSTTPAAQPTPTSSLTKEQLNAYNKQTTVKGKAEVLLDAGVDRSIIEQLVRRPIADILAGRAEKPSSTKVDS